MVLPTTRPVSPTRFSAGWGSASLSTTQPRGSVMNTHHSARQAVLFKTATKRAATQIPNFHTTLYLGKIRNKKTRVETAYLHHEKPKVFNLAAIQSSAMCSKRSVLQKDHRTAPCCVTQEVPTEHFRSNYGCFFMNCTNWSNLVRVWLLVQRIT